MWLASVSLIAQAILEGLESAKPRERNPLRGPRVPHLMQTRLRVLWPLTGVALAATVALHFASPIEKAHADESMPRGPAAPVLVELFTSEGCSSCPPAEDELSRLDRDQSIPGARVVAVSYHVDYWDRLGWTDPFSSPAWTARQQDYDRATGRVYTPQAIIGGTEDCVGSEAGKLHALVRQAATSPAARVDVTLAPAPSPGAAHVAIRVADVPAVAGGDLAEVRVVLVEKGLAVDVPRGENSGRRLQHAPLARDLKTLGTVSAQGGSFDATFAISPTYKRENLSLVAIVQERGSHRVLGVGTVAL